MIGIVGAGLTGLTIHHYLRQRDVESVVYEAATEPGGVVKSIREDGCVLDCGPQRTRMTPLVEELVETAELSDRVLEAADAPLYVYSGGRLRRAPLSVREAVATDLLSWRGKLRVLLEPFVGPPRENDSVEEYLTRAFGREFATRVGGPLYAGLYASDPDEMPVEHSLAKALDKFGVERSVLLRLLRARLTGRSPSPVVSFRRGMQELPRALYETYSDTVRLNRPVRGLRATPNGCDLVTDSETATVDEVVLTTPAPVSASLLAAVDPVSADALRGLTYNPLAVVHLRAETSLVGAGHQVPFDEQDVTLGVTWNDGLFGRDNSASRDSESGAPANNGRDGVFTCYLGGAKAPEAVEWSEGRLGDVAATEFEEVTGITANPLHVHRVTPGMPAYDSSWESLGRIDPPPGVNLCANYESRAGVPGRIREGKRLANELTTADS